MESRVEVEAEIKTRKDDQVESRVDGLAFDKIIQNSSWRSRVFFQMLDERGRDPIHPVSFWDSLTGWMGCKGLSGSVVDVEWGWDCTSWVVVVGRLMTQITCTASHELIESGQTPNLVGKAKAVDRWLTLEAVYLGQCSDHERSEESALSWEKLSLSFWESYYLTRSWISHSPASTRTRSSAQSWHSSPASIDDTIS